MVHDNTSSDDRLKHTKQAISMMNAEVSITDQTPGTEWECPKCGHRVIAGHKPRCIGQSKEFHVPIEMVPWEDPKRGYE